MTSPSALPAWATVDDLPAASAGMHTPTRWRQLLAMATDMLWAWSGRRWRGGPETVEVVLRAIGTDTDPLWHRSWGVCSCAHPALYGRPPMLGHTRPTRVRLPHSDVTEIVTVEVDGEPITGWRRAGSWVERTDGQGWDLCGGNTAITYVHGLLPPAAGTAACVELAVELGRAAAENPDQPCRLPERVVSVTRQGLTYENESVLDRFEHLDKGRTGLISVDMWLASCNPKSRTGRAKVWTPDLNVARRP